jgi:hopanoid biosynthesis associated protein HpnK
LVDGDSVLGHETLPHITTPDGKFPRDQASLGFRSFFSPAARREMAAEIRAQFLLYAASGLPLHHADAHKHMHLHPTVAAMMIRIGKEFGLKHIRVPAEPPAVLKSCGETTSFAEHTLYRWSNMLRAQARRAGLQTNDHVFGIKWSGRMTVERVATLMQNLPPGSSEIYFHPATHRDETLRELMPDYQHEAELQALLNPA